MKIFGRLLTAIAAAILIVPAEAATAASDHLLKTQW